MSIAAGLVHDLLERRVDLRVHPMVAGDADHVFAELLKIGL